MSALKLIVRRSSLIVNCLIALIFLLSITYYLLPTDASAQVVNPYSFTNPMSPQYTNIQAINLIHTLSCLAEGVSVIGQPCIEYKLQKETGSLVPFQSYVASGGAVGSVAGLLTALYSTPPLSTTEYLSDLGKNLKIVPEAHAQVTGSGNNVLSPILPLWRLTRNIAYLAMIIIFIVVGFMIMFRQKINPQTVISAQAALPGLVVGLILITFSYFLAALVVDASFVGIQVGTGVLVSEGIIDAPTKDRINSRSVFSTFDSFISLNHVNDVLSSTIGTVKSLQDQGAIGGIIQKASAVAGCIISVQLTPSSGVPLADFFIKPAACAVGGGLAALLAGNSTIVGGLTGLILYVVLIIALLIAMFRLLFALVICYITIVISTIAAPFYFLYGSIPGKEGAVSAWFKTMFANILCFPAVILALIFAAYVLGGTDVIKPGTAPSFDPKNGVVPLLGGFNVSFLKIILAYGVLLITPVIPDTVKGAFGVKTSPLGGAAISTAAAGFGVGRATAGRALERQIKEVQLFREASTKASVIEPTTGKPLTKVPWYVGMFGRR